MNEMVPGLLAVVLLAAAVSLLLAGMPKGSDPKPADQQGNNSCEKGEQKEAGFHSFERQGKRWPDDFLDLSGGMLGI